MKSFQKLSVFAKQLNIFLDKEPCFGPCALLNQAYYLALTGYSNQLHYSNKNKLYKNIENCLVKKKIKKSENMARIR